MDSDHDGGVMLIPEATSSFHSKRKRKRERERANKEKGILRNVGGGGGGVKRPKSSDDEEEEEEEEEDGGVRLVVGAPAAAPTTATAAAKGMGKGAVVVDQQDELEEGGVNADIARMDPKLIADYVGQRTKRFEKEASLVELEDLYIPESSFLDTSSWAKPRTLGGFPDFIQTFCKPTAKLDKSSLAPGSPHTLIVSAAALRASHIAKAIRKFQTKDCAVAKLFAKHIKLRESIELCQTTRIGMGVGTPGRILELMKQDALKTTDLKRIIIDASHTDKKSCGIFDIRDTQKAVVELLNWPRLKSRLGSGREDVAVVFY